MTYDQNMLRQMNEEAQLRISELSAALEHVTANRDLLEDALDQRNRQIIALEAEVAQLNARLSRLQHQMQIVLREDLDG
jgi:chromosome segregation ATPase